MLRAHLILNPEARGVTPVVTRVVQAALEAHFKLETTETHARDAGIDVARRAVDDGNEFVIAFGGDGLVNEVANGMAGSDATLAIIPGGTMNVLARNLGLPRDHLEATDLILQSAGQIDPQPVSLGRANDRYFTFACGCGFDAEAARTVENHKPYKQRFGEPFFYATALATFAGRYFTKAPFLRCEGSFGNKEAVMVIAAAPGPYAYLGGRPVRFKAPEPSGRGLDLFTMRRLRYEHLPFYLVGSLLTGSFGPNAATIGGVERFTVSADEPFAIHVDGESLDPEDRVDVVANAAMLRILI